MDGSATAIGCQSCLNSVETVEAGLSSTRQFGQSQPSPRTLNPREGSGGIGFDTDYLCTRRQMHWGPQESLSIV